MTANTTASDAVRYVCARADAGKMLSNVRHAMHTSGNRRMRISRCGRRHRLFYQIHLMLVIVARQRFSHELWLDTSTRRNETALPPRSFVSLTTCILCTQQQQANSTNCRLSITASTDQNVRLRRRIRMTRTRRCVHPLYEPWTLFE